MTKNLRVSLCVLKDITLTVELGSENSGKLGEHQFLWE